MLSAIWHGAFLQATSAAAANWKHLPCACSECIASIREPLNGVRQDILDWVIKCSQCQVAYSVNFQSMGPAETLVHSFFRSV